MLRALSLVPLLLSAAPRLAAADELPAPVAEQRDASWLVPSLHALSLMTVMRGTEAYLWPEPFANTARFAYHYEQAYTHWPRFDSGRFLLESDGDHWPINVIGHGLLGSELYLRARVCRKPPWQALLFTAAATGVWEYGFEANGVRPSALDLTYTPLSGLLLGEGRFQLFELARKLRAGAPRAVLRAVVDPLGELERAWGSPC